jgi:hypothetical protein
MPELSLRVFDAKLEPLPIILISRKGAHVPAPLSEFLQIIRAHFSDPANQ